MPTDASHAASSPHAARPAGASSSTRADRVPWLLPQVELTALHLDRISIFAVAKRLVIWTLAFLRYTFAAMQDRWRGRYDERQRGRRLRAMLERVGGTAIKVGQQMALRVDMLPFEVCEELNTLLDAVPPFPLKDVESEIEEAVGGPLDTVFASIDPEPIGSASVAGVFKGVLLDGREVAIKVRRPGVAAEFQADLIMFKVVTRLLEFFTVVRIGYFHHLRAELWSMLITELDFRSEADLQVHFRGTVKRFGFKQVTAPAVYGEISNDRVLISEYVDALAAGDFLAAVERGDAAQLALWKADGICPRKVARNLMELSYCGQFEFPFYHADPHPGNILILPDSRIVMLDFGACGQLPHWQRITSVEFLRRSVQHDFGGAAQMGLAGNSPLPYLDIEEVVDRMQQVFWRSIMIRYSGECDWWERTSAAGWAKTVEALGEFNIQANAETLRMFRAMLLYETLVSRLCPSLEQKMIFRRWTERSSRRSGRLFRREIRRRGIRNMNSEWAARAIEMGQLVRVGATNNQIRMTRLPPDFRSLVNVASYATSQILGGALKVFNLLALATVGLLIYESATEGEMGLLASAKTVVTHPVTLMVVGLVIVRTWRAVTSRLRADRVRRD